MTNTNITGNEALKKSALTWTIVGFICGGVVAGVLGLIGYLKADTEPQTAATLTKWAKIVTIIMIVLQVLIWGFVIAMNIFAFSVAGTSGGY